MGSKHVSINNEQVAAVALLDASGGVTSIGPATAAFAITPDDETALTTPTRALWVGSTGDLTVTMDGDDVTFANVPDGTLLPIVITHVKEATTATDLVGLT